MYTPVSQKSPGPACWQFFRQAQIPLLLYPFLNTVSTDRWHVAAVKWQ